MDGHCLYTNLSYLFYLIFSVYAWIAECAEFSLQKPLEIFINTERMSEYNNVS